MLCGLEYGDGGETAFLEGSEYSHPHHTAQEAVKNSPNKYCSGVKNVAMKLKKVKWCSIQLYASKCREHMILLNLPHLQ